MASRNVPRCHGPGCLPVAASGAALLAQVYVGQVGVTSITAGTGLSGGTITTTGTIAVLQSQVLGTITSPDGTVVVTVGSSGDVKIADGSGNVFLETNNASSQCAIRQNIADALGSGNNYQVLTSTGRTIIRETGSYDFRASSGGSIDTGIYRIAANVLGAGKGGTTSGGWIQNSGGEASLAAAFTDATGTLAATNLSRTVIAGRVYRFEALLQVSNSTAADGAQFNFNGGTATATTFFAAAQVVGSVVAGTVVTTTLAGVLNWTTTTGTDYIFISGYLKVNGGGTLALQAATNTHVSGTMTLGAGSWLALYDTNAL